MIGFTIAFLHRVGLSPVDDPGLHIHIAMRSRLRETLELIVREWKGQLIVASAFHLKLGTGSRTDEERIELSPRWEIPHGARPEAGRHPRRFPCARAIDSKCRQ